MSGNPLARKPEQPEDEGWLITFADMSVLLMCFFVLLWMMASLDAKQVEEISKGLRDKGFYKEAAPAKDVYTEVKKDLALTINAGGYDQFLATTDAPEGLNVELASAAFFVPGSAKFTPEAVPMLEMLAQKILPLVKSEIMVEVEGHTDDTPIATEQFPSNWELSSARASNVVRFLASKGFPPEKLRAVGLAATQPKAPNRDAEGAAILANQDLNRRVVVKLKKGEDW
jgi:chemotaxis protein MotB